MLHKYKILTCSLLKISDSQDYTLFGGHLHYYDCDYSNGRKYITIGPAVTFWRHDRPGNVDHHITWVLMKKDRPENEQTTLDGVYDHKGIDHKVKEMYER